MYRNKIYKHYGKIFGTGSKGLEPKARAKINAIKRWHLRDWLPFDKNAKIVDLGCGTGDDLLFYEAEGYSNVYGVDVSSSQVAITKNHPVTVLEGDMFEVLKKSEDKFDCVSAFDVIEHLTKDEVIEFLETVFSSLNDGGDLILRTPNASSLFASELRYGDFTHELSFTPHVLAGLLKMVGYNNIVIRECDPPARGYSFFSFIRFCLWKMVRLIIKTINIIETGSSSGTYSRVFLIKGTKI